MASQKDATIIDKTSIPAGKVIGTFTFLRDMGKTLAKNKAIQVTAEDAQEAKKIQNRWRSYFKNEARTRKEIKDDKITVYLWLEKEK